MTGLVLALVLTTLLAPASPDVPPPESSVRLDWVAPRGCPTRQEVLDQLRRLSGVTAGAPAQNGLTLRAGIVAEHDGFAMALEVTSPLGQTVHRLRSADCKALALAVAVVGAVALSHSPAPGASRATEASPELPEPVPPPVATDDLAVSLGPPQPAALDRENARGRASAPGQGRNRSGRPSTGSDPRGRGRLRLVRFALAATGQWGYGQVPGAARFGAGATLGLLGPHWRVEVRGLSLPRPAAAPHALGLWSLGATACGVPVFGRVELPLCGGFEGGQWRTTGTQPSGSAVKGHPFGAFSFGPRIGFAPRPYIALLTGVEAVIPFVRPQIDLPTGTSYQSSPAGVRVQLGIELRVP